MALVKWPTSFCRLHMGSGAIESYGRKLAAPGGLGRFLRAVFDQSHPNDIISTVKWAAWPTGGCNSPENFIVIWPSPDPKTMIATQLP